MECIQEPCDLGSNARDSDILGLGCSLGIRSFEVLLHTPTPILMAANLKKHCLRCSCPVPHDRYVSLRAGPHLAHLCSPQSVSYITADELDLESVFVSYYCC